MMYLKINLSFFILRVSFSDFYSSSSLQTTAASETSVTLSWITSRHNLIAKNDAVVWARL